MGWRKFMFVGANLDAANDAHGPLDTVVASLITCRLLPIAGFAVRRRHC
jgi:hypothetical protein